jgi:hypothetical protein
MKRKSYKIKAAPKLSNWMIRDQYLILLGRNPHSKAVTQMVFLKEGEGKKKFREMITVKKGEIYKETIEGRK